MQNARASLYQTGQFALLTSLKMSQGSLTKSRPSPSTKVTKRSNSAGRGRAVAGPEAVWSDAYAGAHHSSPEGELND